MVESCVSRNMEFPAGELSAAMWSVPRVVFDQTFASTGDGSLGATINTPGKLLIDTAVQSWVSDSPLPARLLLRVQRSRRFMITSNPNAVQIRDRITTSLDGFDPQVPDVSGVYRGESGIALDIGTTVNGVPLTGRYWMYEDPTLSEDWLGPLEVGGTFKFHYKCYVWTPPPYSNNANNSNPEHQAHVYSTRVQVMAFPTQDSEVSS